MARSPGSTDVNRTPTTRTPCSSFADTTNPIEVLLPQLAQLRADNPALESGATIVRYAHHGVLAMSRIDAAAKREYLVLTNNGTDPAQVTVQTSTPSSAWEVLFGDPAAPQSGAGGKLTVTVPAVGALVLEAASPIPVSAPPRPTVKVVSDAYTNLYDVTARVTGKQPLTVAFAWRRAGSSTWQRLDVDDSPPYRGFLDPTKFRRNERIQLVAIARSLDGRTSTSTVVAYRLPGR